MHQTFTGASRRPRQVNLSGRKANPFAAAGAAPGPQQALQNAQHDRQQRQRQRQELAAAKSIQRVWRGHRSRSHTKQERRTAWDDRYVSSGLTTSVVSERQAFDAARLLTSFADPGGDDDLRRLSVCRGCLAGASPPAAACDSKWNSIFVRLQSVCVRYIERVARIAHSDPSLLDDVLESLNFVAARAGAASTEAARALFRSISNLSVKSDVCREKIPRLMDAVFSEHDQAKYNGLLLEFLTRPQTPDTVEQLVHLVHRPLLLNSARDFLQEINDTRRSVWLLGHIITLLRFEYSGDELRDDMSFVDVVLVVGTLLANLANGFDIEGEPIAVDNYEYDLLLASGEPNRTRLNPYLKRSLVRLVDQASVRKVIDEFQHSESQDSTRLATYILTLLRVFRNHADDIRMWLYLGSSTRSPTDSGVNPIAFFWREAKRSSVVRSISSNARSAVSLIVNRPVTSAWQAPGIASQSESVTNEWKVILIFLELYTFVLKLMDDEEFLGQTVQNVRSRSNPLSIPEIADLVTFLKHLGFSMYYHSQQIASEMDPQHQPLSKQSLSRHFAMPGYQASSPTSDTGLQPILVAGLTGITVDYVKFTATGILRSVYERDSRRKFLPKGHWLMTSELDMSNFITDVVAEEESRHQIQEMEIEDGGQSEEEADVDTMMNMNSHIRRMMDVERKQRALRKQSRKRYLESVAPRLEILQNMPFLIPFETRVKIFRQFVRLDQVKRRNGFVDPDIWRQSLLSGGLRGDAERELNRHHAKVRRQHEFEDAKEQFFDLGPSLKEPIQITFVDEFDMVEAGIDGGGVTKEFITSASAQAFNPSFGLFKSNDQHLLYPNPTAIDELKEKIKSLDKIGQQEDYRAHLQDLLESFEFSGRIVGKCLYEGILVDISFASFFLIKWALTGASGLQSQDSAYRANINDLRDLDEGLYQGLLSLKNYQGNVEDLSLTFSVTDEIPVEGGKTTTVERELIPNGSNTPVTNENRLVYISRVARYRLQGQAAPQTNAFLKGLASIVQPSWLSMFNQSELQNLVGGSATSIDIEDLRRNTIYSGLYVIGNDKKEHPVIQLFWRTMQEISDEDKGRVLKFVTSTPRAPLLGFGSLNPKFSIRDSGDDESRFPTTSTCINLLKLPRYKSQQTLKQKLLYAINSGAGFDLS